MLISPKIDWTLDDGTVRDIEPVLFRILNAVRIHGSLKQSARISGLSYRHAWGLLKKWEENFNQILLLRERGRGGGARLTDFAERLLWGDEYLNTRLQPIMEGATAEVNESLGHYLRPQLPTRVKLYASHDMAIGLLHEHLRAEPGVDLEFETHGSLESLENLHRGHCQLAGFHLPQQLVHDGLSAQYRYWLSPHKHALMKIATRNQGLFVKKSNPKKIVELVDLCKRSVRFINRQRSSGTRAVFDQLVAHRGIDSNTITGYADEEFTHVAVAAMIASGAADAGFGIEAAAVQFELDFIPFLQEAYVLAIDNGLQESLLDTIRKILRSENFRMKVNDLAGYNADDAGEEIQLTRLLGG